jgi:hypothetical protein
MSSQRRYRIDKNERPRVIDLGPSSQPNKKRKDTKETTVVKEQTRGEERGRETPNRIELCFSVGHRNNAVSFQASIVIEADTQRGRTRSDSFFL